MRYYIEMFGSYEEGHWFDFPSYEAAYKYLYEKILQNVKEEDLIKRDPPDYMSDAAYYIAIKGDGKLDRGRDYYILTKEEDEVISIYGGG